MSGEAKPMNWRRTSDTSMRCEPWTVAKVSVKGKVSYELWHDKEPACYGPFDSFALACAAAEAKEGERNSSAGVES